MKKDRARSRKRGKAVTLTRQRVVSEKSLPPAHEGTTAEKPAPEPIKDGWRVRVGESLVEFTSPRPDRGSIRGALTVREGETIHYRNTVNLTSENSRKNLRKVLDEKQIPVSDTVLIALDEACRRPRPLSASAVRGEAAAFPDAPPLTLAELETVFGRWLLIKDPALMPIFVGAVLAHRLPGDPVWLVLVAPPGGTKTELLRALYGYPGIFPLSSLTARTLASGLDEPGKGDVSLLNRLKGEILVLKDLTTVLEISHDERQAILSQLREIYDGRFDKVWGTGHEIHWTGRLGFLAGVTPVIDRHQGAMSVLGERFALLRPAMPGRRQLARSALASAGREGTMRKALARALHGFLRARGTEPPRIDDSMREKLVAVADFTTRARSGVVRDGYKRHLEYAPEPEAPTRFAKVLLSEARGVALAYDSEAVTPREIGLVLRLALDCLPVIRRKVIEILARAAHDRSKERSRSADEIARALPDCSLSYVRRTLDDLGALRILDRTTGGKGEADRWALQDRWVSVFDTLVARDGGLDFSGKPRA